MQNHSEIAEFLWKIADLIKAGVDAGLSPAELGDSIETWTGWDEYRAERIATTELRSAYNQAARESYAEAGVTLGNLYNDGLDVKQDYVEAFVWYGVAAAQGNFVMLANAANVTVP